MELPNIFLTLWTIALLHLIDHSEGIYTITARQGIVRTRNFQTATLEWIFNFAQNDMAFMDIRMKNHQGQETKIALLKNNQWQAYNDMRDRLRISIPPNRNGIIIDIPNIVISDGGDYTCKAISLDGEIHNITRLVVIVPPRIDKRQTRLNRDEGRNASLLCNLEAGNPKPLTFQWFKMMTGRTKKPLTPVKTRDYNLTWFIANVGRDTLGKYRCDVGGLGGVDSHVVDLHVRYKPVVTSPPLNRTVLENFGSEQLTCLCEGNAGPMRYHWYKDKPLLQFEIKDNQKEMLISRSRTSLTFTRPKRALAGMYFCAGSNDLGTGKPKGAYLNVTYKPGAIELTPQPDQSNSVNAKEGTNLTVNCFSDANPPAHYKWYKKVKTFWGSMENEYLVKYSLSGELHLANVDRNDTAYYVCDALNRPNDEDTSRVFTTQREVRINIRFGPKQTNFTVNNRNDTYIEVKRYSKVTIRCVSHSEPVADYYIRMERDKTQLNKKPKVGLVVIERITADQEGVYVCISSNLYTGHNEKRKITVVVAVPPVRRDPVPDSKTPTEGATLSIDCYGMGKPAPTVFWQRWGANITHNDSVIQTYYKVDPVKEGILSKVESKLKFTGIRYTDDASYSCILNNSAGIYNISNIRYRVQFSPKLTQWPGNFTTRIGKKVIFVCQAFGNPTSVQWRWYHNDVEIKGETKTSFIREYTSPEDNGRYTCEPWNPIGNGKGGTGNLEVQYKPRFTKVPNGNYTRDATEALSIECDAIAVPTPEIYWIKFGSSTFRKNGKILSFAPLKATDRGKYSCIAKNVVNSEAASTLIIVRHRPYITTTTPADTMIGSKDGHPVSLKCDVNAYPTAVVLWKDKLKDTVIQHGPNYKIVEEKTLFSITSTLKFTVHSSQLGKKYVCYAKNDYGSITQDFQVLVEGRPDPPESGTLIAIDYLMPTVPVTVNINFTWVPGYNGGADVDFYLLYREKRESRFHEHHMSNREGFKYVFKHRKAAASYVFSMKASNKYGVSQIYKPNLYLETKDPPANAANVTIERIGSDGKSVRIFWSIQPTLRVKRAIYRKWEYAVVRYKFADVDSKWKEEVILKIPLKGSFVVSDLQPERLYVFHFILYDKQNNFAAPILIGRIYPRYGPALPSRSELSKIDIIAIGVACGGAILIVAVIILVIAICKKSKKPAYGIASYGNGRARVDIPVSATMKSGGYNDEVVRASYFKANDDDEEEDDDDPLAQDSASGIDSGLDKYPPPDYNAVHYTVPPVDNPTQGSFSDTSPSYTTFGRLVRDPQYNAKDGVDQARSMQSLSGSRATEIARGHDRYSCDLLDDYPTYRANNNAGLGQPLLRQSNNDLDEDYRKPPERIQGHGGSRGHLSSEDEDVPPEPPRIPPSDESDMNNRVPGAFEDRAQRFKKPPYKSYDEENRSFSSPVRNDSGRQSPNGSSVASSKPYRSDNEYIEEADENYVGYLV